MLNEFMQVAEVEKEFEAMKEKLESDRCSTNKFNEKVDEWKVSFSLAIIAFCIWAYCLCLNQLLNSIYYLLPAH